MKREYNLVLFIVNCDIENKDPEFLKVLGRLQYRTSYGQNILFHSFEVGFFSQILANLLGEDPREAFLAGFFHDVGKALDQEKEGTHDLLGKEFLEAHGFDTKSITQLTLIIILFL